VSKSFQHTGIWPVNAINGLEPSLGFTSKKDCASSSIDDVSQEPEVCKDASVHQNLFFNQVSEARVNSNAQPASGSFTFIKLLPLVQ